VVWGGLRHNVTILGAAARYFQREHNERLPVGLLWPANPLLVWANQRRITVMSRLAISAEADAPA
jgi:hypothetical protein